MTLTVIRHSQNLLFTANSFLEELEICIERLSSEELVYQRLQNLIVEVIINLSTED